MLDLTMKKHQLPYICPMREIKVNPSEWSASRGLGYAGYEGRGLPTAGYQLLNSSPIYCPLSTGGGDLGSVGDFAAGSEMAFCTLLQRSYAVLGGRMYLGSSTGAGWE